MNIGKQYRIKGLIKSIRSEENDMLVRLWVRETDVLFSVAERTYTDYVVISPNAWKTFDGEATCMKFKLGSVYNNICTLQSFNHKGIPIFSESIPTQNNT